MSYTCNMKIKKSNIFILIFILISFALPLISFAQNYNQIQTYEILLAQQTQPSKGGLWDMPPPTGVQTGTADISSAPDNDIRIILSDIASKTKKMADMAVDKADDKLTPIKPVGEVASHGGGGEALNQWATYWANLSKGLDMSGKPIPRGQWRSMFEGADKLKQWQQYREWFASQADKLQRLGTAISIVDSGSKVAGALWEGEGKLAVITLADEVCKVGTITFGTLFGAPWGPGGAIAGAFTAEELWRKFGSPKFEQRAQFVKNMEIWNKSAGDIVRKKIGSLPEFESYMEGKISEAEFRVKIREYAEKYKKENESKKKQHERELQLLRKQAQTEPGLKELIDAWQSGKLPKAQKPLLVEALRRAIRAEKGASAKAGDEFECKIDDPPISSQTQSSQKTIDEKTKGELYGCICWCTINPTVGVGASYNPKPIYGVLSSPSCEDPRYGPCVGAGLGCWRQHMNASGECFDRCVKNIGGDAQKIKSEIDKMKLDAFNDFIKEARGIIEEYISKIVPSVYRKKASSHNGGSYPLFAQNITNNMIDNQPLYAAAASPDAPMTYIEMIKEKNRRGDPDKALSLVNSAVSILPDRKGEVQNVLAEFAIMMSKASLNIVTDLEFDEGLYLLRKAAEFYKVGESLPLGQNIKRLITAFEKWKKDWETLNREIPVCLSLIKDRQVCGCDKLYKDKIYPTASSLTIYEFASSEKWGISTATGSPRPIPQKDKIFEEIKTKLSLAKSQCELNPALSTKEMKDLIDYETRKTLEQSPYINQDDLKKYSAPVICDTRAVKYAEKMLSTTDLCDCQQDKIKNILNIAKKYAEPLQSDFISDVKEITAGQYVRLDFRVKGGKAPFTYEMSGDYPYHDKSDARGFTIQYQPKATGTITYYATVVDSCGDSDSKKLSVNIKPTAVSKAPDTPKHNPPVTTKTPPYSPPVPPPVDKTPPTKAPVYDPTKDISVSSGNKTVDIAQVDKAADDFQKGHIGDKTNTIKDNKGQQTPITQSDTYIGKTQPPPQTTQPPYQEPPTYYPPSDVRSVGKDWTDWSKNKPPVTGGNSNQSGSTWTGGTTGTAPTVPVDTRTVACNTATKSGADAPATITVNVGRAAGTIKFYYEMYSVKDRMIVQYAGYTLYDTGCVSNSKTVSLNLSGASDSVIVMVQPQCEKKDSTQWNFKVECPQPVQGPTTATGGTSSNTVAGQTSSSPAVFAELTNQSKGDVHIFVEGQDNFGPQNKLAPGEGNRKVSVRVPAQGGRIKFIAGRNGQKLAECLWDYTPDSTSRVPVVTFYEPNRLSCVTGLR
jgi:hypothetical protein